MIHFFDRLDKYLKYKDLNDNKVTVETGISNGLIGKGRKRGSLSQQNISKILHTYKDLNANWLLTGEGSMLKDEPKEGLIEASGPGQGIPLIPLDAMAGFGAGELQVMDYEVKRYRVPEFEALQADYLIRVKGSSMTPHYNSGDIVACRELVLTDVFFQWNKVYVLDTDQGPLIKRVQKCKTKDHLLLKSDNEAYAPFEVPLSKIYALALVVGCIRLE